jgi:carbon monoxide dehydrogenase subunit G
MPEIAEQSRIAAPLDVVWPLLSDPQAVAGCIPGAELAPDKDDGVWRGSVKVRFGPTTATFRGEAHLDFDHDMHRCTIEGRGIDQRGASRALSSGTVQASAEGEATLLDVRGSFTVTGPLETFANAGGVHVARALLAEFAGNMAKLVAERAPAPGSATAAEAASEVAALPGVDAPAAAAPRTEAPCLPRPATELSAATLLWRAFLSWLRSLFGKGSP